MMNLAGVDTIYKKRFRTLSLKVDERFQSSVGKTASFRDPSEIYHSVLQGVFKNLDDGQEHFVVLFLNAKNRVIGYKVLFSGSQVSSVCDMAVIYRNAILFGAQGLIVAHNHPSNDLTISTDDRVFTQDLVRVGGLHGIRVLDHIIVNHTTYTSMAFMEPAIFDD